MTTTTTMENLEQIHQTLSDIDGRIPDAIRVALGLHRVSPAPAPGEDDDVADFAISLLQPLATEDGGDRGPADPDVAASGLRIEWGSCYVPLHDHDAHFGDAIAGAFGVADGVGQYMDAGVDAGAFSRGLMASASAEVAGLEPGTPVCPHALLERAYEKTAAAGAPGASTAVILSLAAGNALAWAYIGDSAFAVLRGSKIVFLSTPQRHLSRTSRSKLHFSSTPARRKEHLFSFNDPPFQLSAVGERSDSVVDAVVGQVAVRAGDVVVAGTDGLFDNVLDEQLERAVQMGTKLGFSPKNMADIIAGVAYERSNQSSSRRLRMGKPDDITVLVAFVVPLDS
ncbi:hypothetical protein SEVIR_1G347000v4 [Setaria viridis]|nr:putative protein phosphatase 2C 23 [Setaria viridis]